MADARRVRLQQSQQPCQGARCLSRCSRQLSGFPGSSIETLEIGTARLQRSALRKSGFAGSLEVPICVADTRTAGHAIMHGPELACCGQLYSSMFGTACHSLGTLLWVQMKQQVN